MRRRSAGDRRTRRGTDSVPNGAHTTSALLAWATMIAGGMSTPAVAALPVHASTEAAETAAATHADTLVARRPASLHAGPDETFARKSVISSGQGHYVPYERRYRGVPVVGGDLVLVVDDGRVTSTSVAQARPIGRIETTPTVSRADAERIAGTQLQSVSTIEDTRLVVDALGASPRLAWETIVNGTGADGTSRLSVEVDATTGAVLATKEHVLHGFGISAWNGPNPVNLTTTNRAGTFLMSDPTITNLSCQVAANSVTLSGPDDVWGNGNPTSVETGCVDALFGAQTEAKMLSQWLGRNAMDGIGGAWPIRVGMNQINTFYDGTQVQIGHNVANQWLGSIDLIAHEMGHGVDDHTPGGTSGGGTQEFIADAFGAATEWFANEPSPGDVPDFTVGEQVNVAGTGAIRVMSDPSQKGDPNCYSADIPTADVHAAAGPGNHWFYLLAMGSNPTNGQPASPTCNGSTVTGLGVETAMKILYNAMLRKTTASSYLTYRTWTLQAAKNLSPASCTAFTTVKAAWDAVSVPAQAGDPTCIDRTALVPTNSGSQIGTVGTAVSVSLSASGGVAPYKYSATGLPAGLSIDASTGLISGTPTTPATSSVTVTVTDSATPAPAVASQVFTWTINAAPCASPGQKLANPGFESGPTSWTATVGVIGQNGPTEAAHSGTFDAWFNGYGNTHTDTMSQSVTLPTGCSRYILSFWLHIDSAETTTTTMFDKLTVKAGATTLATYSNLNKATGYVQKTFDLGAFAGQTVTVQFTGTEDISLQTSFVIDDAALTVS